LKNKVAPSTAATAAAAYAIVQNNAATIAAYAKAHPKPIDPVGMALKKTGAGLTTAVDSLGNAVNVVWKDIADKVYDLIESEVHGISSGFYSVFHSPLWQGTIQLMTCLESGVAGAAQIILVFKGFETKISELIEAAAADLVPAIVVIINLVIDMICNYKDFLVAFNYLAEAISATTAPQKANDSGRFIGGLIHAIGTS